MANTEIDSLSLEIEIKGLNEKQLSNLDKLSRAVARLSKSLETANFSKLKDIKVPKGISNIQIVSQNISNSLGNATGSSLDELKSQLEDLGFQFEEASQGIEDSALKVEKGADKSAFAMAGWNKESKKAQQTSEGTGKKVTALGKAFKKFSSVLGRIKLIAFIKMIRAVLNAIAKGIKEGITNLAGFDSEFNETMSQLKTAWTTITSSFGLIARPILEVIQPAITQISQAVATLGNEISRIQATMKGASTYTKVSAKYMDDFAKSSQKATLFSFDTFNTLDTGDNSGMFETASVDEETTEQASELFTFVSEIQTLLTDVIDLIKVVGKEVINIVEKLLPSLNIIIKFVRYLLNTITPLLDAIFTALEPIIDVILVDLLPTLLEIVSVCLVPILDIISSLTPIIAEIIKAVADILTPIIKAFVTAIQPAIPFLRQILHIITDLIDLALLNLMPAIKMTEQLLKPIVTIIEWVFTLIGNIGDVFADLINGDMRKFGEDMEKFFMNLFYGIIRVIASVIDAVINIIVEAINGLAGGFNWLFEKLGWDWHWGITWRSNLADQVPRFENGGIVGEVWQMNEKGNAEMLYNPRGSGGDTSVINQAQLSLAFENAIYNTGLLDAIAKAGIINIDGKYVAQSQNFKNEINRTNPGLNIR